MLNIAFLCLNKKLFEGKKNVERFKCKPGLVEEVDSCQIVTKDFVFHPWWKECSQSNIISRSIHMKTFIVCQPYNRAYVRSWDYKDVWNMVTASGWEDMHI